MHGGGQRAAVQGFAFARSGNARISMAVTIMPLQSRPDSGIKAVQLTGPQDFLPELQGAAPGNGRDSPRLG